jgi:F-type H+-transporting ATPase subunit epsilon
VADKLLRVRVVSPDRIVFDGEGSAVVAPAWDGQVGILPGHAPMLALVGSGVLSVERAGGGSDAFHVAGGVLKVERNQVTVLTEYAGDAPPPKPLPDTVVYPEDAAALA